MGEDSIVVVVLDRDELDSVLNADLYPLVMAPIKGGRLVPGVIAVMQSDDVLLRVEVNGGLYIDKVIYIVCQISTPMLKSTGSGKNFKEVVTALIIKKDD